MELRQSVCEELKIPWHYLNVIDKTTLLCMVNKIWLQKLIFNQTLPADFPRHEKLSDAECDHLLHQLRFQDDEPWCIVCIRAIKKIAGSFPRLSKLQKVCKGASQDLSYSQLLHYISETNYKNLWKEAYKKYSGQSCEKKAEVPQKLQPFSSVVQDALQRLYACPFISVQTKESSSRILTKELDPNLQCALNCHQNVLPAFCIIESEHYFYVVQPYFRYSVYDCVTFSPAIFKSSYSKPLFIIYQILHAVRELHDLGLCLGDVTLSDIFVDSNLWVQVHPKILQSIHRLNGIGTKQTSVSDSSKTFGDLNPVNNAMAHMTVDSSTSLENEAGHAQTSSPYVPQHLQNCSLSELVEMWMRKEVCNFDYLMALNNLSGRRVGDPNYHPVLPWIMDFTVPDGGWRDLTKSKFRLNKGDRQLDLTYETLPATALLSTSAYPVGEMLQVPHHVSDVLSEITYYVYKARQTPRSVLCRFVRSNWVPAEYPSSMQRMYEWTPDECIPEFFVDPTIFCSIHSDLQDLEIPWWAASPEDFVNKHRAALDGMHVSERLHHWIDLTFGYKLSGAAAVKAKNVCLHVVDQHTSLKSGGVVQLFSQPHPHRMGPSSYLSANPPLLHRSTLVKEVSKKDKPSEESTELTFANGTGGREQSDGEFQYLPMFIERRRTSTRPKSMLEVIKSEQRSEVPIILPKDYNALARLNQLEALYNFNSKTTYSVPKQQECTGPEKLHSFHHRKIRDMIVIGCLIAELFLAPKLRALTSKATLEERYQLICSFLKTDFFELPRCIRKSVTLLLQLNGIHDLSCIEVPKRMPAITDEGLPPPSAHQLLQPLIEIFPFPHYFQKLYFFLSEVKQFKHKIVYEQLMQNDVPQQTVNIENWAENEVKITVAVMRELLPQLSEEGLGLIVPYLQEMFVNSHTAILAAWYLFNMVGKALGPALTAKKLIEPLTRLFDTEYPTTKHMKLFHRSYLLQLMIRFGLQTFLAYFTTLLIEAVGGFRDFRQGDQKCQETRDIVRKGSHLRSPELESLTQDNEQRDTDDTVSPFDESSCQTETFSPWNKNESENHICASFEHEAEPEIFVFEPAIDDIIDEGTERIETDMDLLDQLEHKFAEDSSDSTSGDALSIGEQTTESGPSPTADIEEHLETNITKENSTATVDRPLNPSSFSEGFSVATRMKHLMDNEVYSSSVPNISSSFLTSKKRMTSLNIKDEVEVGLEIDASSLVISKELPAQKNYAQWNISDVAMESIIWLSHRLGPVLTAKYLSRNLLRMLSLCYLGEEQLKYLNTKYDIEHQKSDISITISPRELVGDSSSQKVLECLTSIASLYGEHFILLQYLPHMTEVVAQAKRRITASCEAAVVGNMVLIHHIVPYLSDATLMDHLQDTIIKDILYPTVRLIASQRTTFPSGGQARQAIAYKLLNALYLIGLRIGFEMTRKHLTPILQRFFKTFSRVHTLQSSSNSGNSATNKKDSPKDFECLDQSAAMHSHIDRLKASCDSMSPPISEKVVLDSQSIYSLAKKELSTTFTPELAFSAYIPFCKLAGSIHMERSLMNDDLIHQLCLQYDKDLSMADFVSDDSEQNVEKVQMAPAASCSVGNVMKEKEHCEEMQKNVAVIGNRIDIHLDEDEMVPAGVTPIITSPHGDATIKIADYPKCDITKLISKQMDNGHRHLKGNWFAYWEHEIGRSEKDHRFNFKQIKLQTFVGHCNSIRTIHVLDNENSFISGSKDKTVKLWSLRSIGDGSAHTTCQWTYTNHKKSVFSVTFLESLRYVASCDSTVHVWDPFMGTSIRQFDSTKNSPVTVLTAMPAPSTVVLSATTEGSARFMDVRTLRYTHEYKVSLGSAGLIRCLAVSPNGLWIAIGHSSGIISILDARTGLMSSTWKGHEGEVLQIKAFNNNTFVTSSLDQCVSVWNADDGKLRCHLRGPTEPVHCFSFYKNEMISGTTANRIGVHTSIESQASFSSTRLRADTFKGVLTSLTVLPLNRLLLLGADNGAIRLLC